MPYELIHLMFVPFVPFDQRLLISPTPKLLAASCPLLDSEFSLFRFHALEWGAIAFSAGKPYYLLKAHLLCIDIYSMSGLQNNFKARIFAFCMYASVRLCQSYLV